MRSPRTLLIAVLLMFPAAAQQSVEPIRCDPDIVCNLRGEEDCQDMTWCDQGVPMCIDGVWLCIADPFCRAPAPACFVGPPSCEDGVWQCPVLSPADRME